MKLLTLTLLCSVASSGYAQRSGERGRGRGRGRGGGRDRGRDRDRDTDPAPVDEEPDAPTEPGSAPPTGGGAAGGGGSGGGGTIRLPSGVPKSYDGCNDIDDYPSTPFEVPPFQQPFKQAPVKPSNGTVRNSQAVMDVYDFEELYVPDYELVPRDICPGGTKMLLYDGIFPGPTIVQPIGHQTFVRYTNKVNVNQPGNPYGEEDEPWGIGKERHNLCAERVERTGNPSPGEGRAMTVHNHGMLSLAPFDGWAEDVHCFGESKDYVLPGNRPAHFWFHDHALATTSENMYAGMEASHIVNPCVEPYNMQAIPQYVVHFLDAVMDRDCQMVYDKRGAHFDNLWGDVNLVNGVAWPVLKVQPRAVRFRILNGAVARALQLNFKDADGEVYSDRCRIVGADGGPIGKDRTGPLGGRAFPRKGLFTSNAYRWDVVCDFRGLEGSLYLTNDENDDLMKPVPPMWCNSHLLMRIDISEDEEPSEPLNAGAVSTAASAFDTAVPDYTQLPPQGTVVDQEIGEALINRLTRQALDGDYDREFDYKKQGDYWVIQDNWGWTHNIDDVPKAVVADAEQRRRDRQFSSHLVATDVGQNFVETWELQSGGGWVHPVHAHLIQWYVVALDGKPVYESDYPELWNVPKDSIQVGGGIGKVGVIARYGPSLGRYLFHCHNAVHEDRDMMMAFAIVPPGIAQQTAAATGFDGDIARMFRDVGGDYNNGDLNARYGDRFYPAVVGGSAAGDIPRAQTLPLMRAADEWHSYEFYSSFYIDVPENVWALTEDDQC